MGKYSILLPFLGRDDVEEISVNRWDNVAVTYTDRHMEKLKEHFFHPQHAIDIVKRLLHHSEMIIDNTTPHGPRTSAGEYSDDFPENTSG